MNRRTELKLENAKIYTKKYILSGKYKVRNTLAVLTAAALIGTVGITVKAVTDNSAATEADNKTVSAMVAEETQVEKAEAEKTEYVITLSDDAYLADNSIDTLKGRLDDSDAVLAKANDTESLTASENDMTGKFIVTTEGLNLRAEGSEDGHVLGVLNTGDTGTVIGFDGDWTLVSNGDSEGYVKSEYIIVGEDATKVAKKALLCGSGELGKEVAIELQRFGVEVVALDRYENAPAMQVAHRSYVLSMLDGAKLREIIEKEQPDIIIPEVEAIATPTLVELEKEGYHVIPTANAAFLTMNRKGIRQLAHETLGLPTSNYRFATTREEFDAAISAVGTPCVVKPIMSSSGHGQSVCKTPADADKCWHIAQEGGRAGAGEVIVEGFVKFDYEITLLTVRHAGGTTFLNPIGHHQVDGDYRESWQAQPMSEKALAQAQDIAKKITDALGGYGIFGVEMFRTSRSSPFPPARCWVCRFRR